MEESKIRIFWKKHYQQVLLVFIRIMEVFVSSIIPSFLGVILIFVNPNRRIWDAMSAFSMIGFAVINCWFLLRYTATRGRNRLEFYVVNGIAYLSYIGLSIIAYHHFGYLLYSMIFANLRVFEIFDMKTIHSIYLSDSIILCTMLVFRKFAKEHISFIQRLMRVEEVDVSELERYYSEHEPTQNNQNVNFMSLEEMNDNIINEIKEAHEAYLKAYEETSDDMWEAFQKGEGEKIQYAIPEDPDNDYDESDWVVTSQKNMSGYSTDSLWNDDIYGKDGPIVNYEDEVPLPESPKQTIMDRVRADATMNLNSFNRMINIKRENLKNEIMRRNIDMHTEKGVNIHQAYDSEALWEGTFYKGTDKDTKPEHVLDFDETPELRTNTGLEEYDEGRLWDIDKSKFLSEDEALEEDIYNPQINPNEEYETGSLWSSNIRQGSGRVKTVEFVDEHAETSQNVNEEYDSDSLWSKDFRKGRE